jgi:hypothetical protein
MIPPDRFTVGQVDGRPATICLSGSTVILKDVVKVGDIDFCEYIPADVPPASLAQALEEQIRANDLRHCIAAVRLRNPSGGSDTMQFLSITPQAAFTNEQLERIRQLFEMSRNGQTFHLVATAFAGITEVTNWLIIFQAPLENDPVSALSFAHQEASLGVYGRRPLHTLEGVATYLSFLRAEIQKHSAPHPVKAYKRSISWLRLFGDEEMLEELNKFARKHQATAAAALLSKIEIWEKYNRTRDLNDAMQELVTRLRVEIDQEAGALVGATGDKMAALKARVAAFGADCNLRAGTSKLNLWDRVLSLANP